MARQLPTHADLVMTGWAKDESGEEPVTVTRVFAGHSSTTRATKLQHAYAAEMVRQRQAAGYFTPCEAAQELENFSLVPNAVEFLNQRLLPAIRSGELRAFSESDRFPLVGREVNPMGDLITREGVNAWLQSLGVRIKWCGEEPLPASAQGSNQPIQDGRSNRALLNSTKQAGKRGGDLLSELIAKIRSELLKEGAEPSAASVYLRLTELAEKRPPQRPLMGVTQSGIQWVDSKDEVRETDLGNIQKRLKTLRGK